MFIEGNPAPTFRYNKVRALFIRICTFVQGTCESKLKPFLAVRTCSAVSENDMSEISELEEATKDASKH